ncbi:hypothetical protein [Streptomyces abikoensis]|uniref:hypothetical protein n=1 Tax=Streptomyces abikoensis TaxID=97398 RepID=UPI0033F2E39F
MTPLERAAVVALTGALREIQQLDDADRRASLVRDIRGAPGVRDFMVDPDRMSDVHLGRIARACVEHRKAPAARRALHNEVSNLAAGHRAVAWLQIFNKVLDSGRPETLKLDLLIIGTTLRRGGLRDPQSLERQDPLREFTRLVGKGTSEEIRAFRASIDDVSDGCDPRNHVEPLHDQPLTLYEPPQSSKRVYAAAIGVFVLLLVGVVVWIVIAGQGDRPAVWVSVRWDTTVLQPNGTATATVAVPGDRTRLVLPLDLRDPNPGSGACRGTVDLSIDGQKPTSRGLSEEVRTTLPTGRSTLTLKLTLKAPQGCKFQINTEEVGFEG